jgi:hypothetical protein
MFEPVYMLRDLYDGPRTGIASGGEYAQQPIGAPLLALAVEQWKIFRCGKLQ